MRAGSVTSFSKLKDKHILVVEDNELMGKILVDLLKQWYRATHVRSGHEALREIKQNPPDIILLDISLRDTSGVEIAKVVRHDNNTKFTPILAMSGSPSEKRQCLQAGCNDFILKPFEISQLLDQLTALLPS
jgi:CheY-like chemotaxis protein